MYLEDDAPFEVVDLEVLPSDDQIAGDLVDPAQKVRFSIKKADIRYSKEKDVARLNVQCKIGPMGVDGNGKYANKILFAELVVWSDPETKNSDWWKKQARFPWKQFQTALGLDPSKSVWINDTFLTSLEGKEFIADIKKPEIRTKAEDGKYVGTGEFKNELANFKKVE